MISRSYADLARFLSDRTSLKYAIGCRFCIRTAPIPLPDASHSTVNGWVKYDKWRTGAVTSGCFSCSKAR